MPPDPLLRAEAISKRYRPSRFQLRGRPPVDAVRDVSLQVDRGKMMGIVGASGSGKSTLARCLSLADPPDAGRVYFEGVDLWAAKNAARRAHWVPRIQLIPQQPAASLNPRFTASEVVAEPLVVQRRANPEERRRLAARWMETVGLKPALDKPALEFSGGERQRLAIARALILEPALLILDESFAGLDLSVQGQIVRLLREQRLACILITHDLALAAGLADEIAVMAAGRIVESGPPEEIVAHPRHPYTRELLDAALALALPEPVS